MAYLIRDIGDKSEDGTPYESLDKAKEFALQNVEIYEHGFEIANTDCDPTQIVYTDKREEVSRTDLIDWDD